MSVQDERVKAARSFIENQKTGRLPVVWCFKVTDEYWNDTAISHQAEVNATVSSIMQLFPGEWAIEEWHALPPNDRGIIEVRGCCVPRNYDAAMQEALRLIEFSVK